MIRFTGSTDEFLREGECSWLCNLRPDGERDVEEEVRLVFWPESERGRR